MITVGPSETIKFLKVSIVYAIEPNFNLLMVVGSNDGRRTKSFHNSDNGRFHPVNIALGNGF